MSPTYLLCFSKIRVEGSYGGPKPSSYKIPTLQRKRSKYKIFMAFNPFCIFDSFSHFRIKSIPPQKNLKKWDLIIPLNMHDTDYGG